MYGVRIPGTRYLGIEPAAAELLLGPIPSLVYVMAALMPVPIRTNGKSPHYYASTHKFTMTH